MKRTGVLAIAMLAATYAPLAKADDIFKGMRGPTSSQIDVRVGQRQDESVSATSGNLILKHWTGDEQGYWGFASLSHQAISSPLGTHSNENLTLGAGRRGTIGKFHFLSYAGATLPIGEKDVRPSPRAGLFGTYLTQRHDLDFAIEQAWRHDAPDILSGGILLGRRIDDRFRIGAGATGKMLSNDNYALGARAVLRYTQSPKLHFELIGDRDVSTHGLSSGKSFTLLGRLNF